MSLSRRDRIRLALSCWFWTEDSTLSLQCYTSSPSRPWPTICCPSRTMSTSKLSSSFAMIHSQVMVLLRSEMISTPGAACVSQSDTRHQEWETLVWRKCCWMKMMTCGSHSGTSTSLKSPRKQCCLSSMRLISLARVARFQQFFQSSDISKTTQQT